MFLKNTPNQSSTPKRTVTDTKVLVNEIAVLDREIQERKQRHEQYQITQEQVEEEKRNLARIKEEIAAVHSTDMETIYAQIAAARTLEQTILHTVEEKEIKIGILDAEIERKEDYNAVLNNEIVALREQKTHFDDLTGTLSKLQGEIGEKNSELHLKREEKETLLDEITVLEQALKDIQDKYDLFDADMTTREREMEKREGEVNIRTQNLDRFERRLTILKDELEKYYNRKFPYISL